MSRHRYLPHTDADVAAMLERYGDRMVMCDRMPEALAMDMGNQMYTVILDTAEQRDEFIHFVQTLA